MILPRRHFFNRVSRSAVAWLSQSAFPNWLPFLVFAQEERPKNDVLVVIFQRGGMDGLNAVVPYGEGRNYYDRRPTIAIPEPGKGAGAALDLDGYFGLHPQLAALKEIYDEGHLSIVHAAGSPDPTRSHFDAMAFMEQGTPGDKMTGTGWLNRHLQSVPWESNSPFRAVGMGPLVQTALQGPVSALALKSITDFHLAGREDQLPMMQRTLAQLYRAPEPTSRLEVAAKETLSTMNYLRRLADTEYTPVKAAEYPYSEYGNGLKQVAQLIKEDVGLEVACVDIGGWDTHEEQGGTEGNFANLLNELSLGLNAFYTDMHEHLDRITVVTMSEFGRRANENASAGTDHGHGNCMFVMGGGVKGGVHARWPGLNDADLDRGDLAITTDYRDVLSEILTTRLGNAQLGAVFPGYNPNALGFLKERS